MRRQWLESRGLKLVVGGRVGGREVGGREVVGGEVGGEVGGGGSVDRWSRSREGPREDRGG